ncbi:hypothetical protein acdb102_48210 [Acidothermaceae bacterium B102]|nr:hypothetical protein acdb102_48210 [Acidothermaceae bacterium B102]
MTDLETLLSNAGQHPGPSDPALVDADVARGRRALTHRRMRRTGTRSLLVGALAVGSFAVVQNQGGHPGTTAAKAPTTVVTKTTTKTTNKATTGTTKIAAIKLVAYTGSQPEGYTVDSVPSGWEIQGVNNYGLVIAPVGFGDTDVSSFEGKIVVMLLSHDAKPLTASEGDQVAVGSGTGIVSNFDRKDGLQLSYQDANGHQVMIQAPLSLHWTDAQLGQFAAGVHVSPTAVAGFG